VTRIENVKKRFLRSTSKARVLLDAHCVNCSHIRTPQGSRAVLNYKLLEYKLQTIVNCEVLRILGRQ